MNKPNNKPQPVPKKSALKTSPPGSSKDKKLVFKEELVEPEPQYLFAPVPFSDDVLNDLEQENFRQVWREVSSKKLEFAAKVLQKFARKFMLCWIITNDRRTELYEELDYIQERLQSDLGWLEMEREDMEQQAQLQVQADLQNAPPEERNEVREHLETIKQLQSELRTVKQETSQIRKDCKILKKKNKQLGYDFKEHAAPMEMAKHKLDNLKDNHKTLQQNAQRFPPTIQRWQDSIETSTQQWKEAQRHAHLYRDCVLKIWDEITVRYPRKHLLRPVRDVLKEEFVQHHADVNLDVKAMIDDSSRVNGSSRRTTARSPRRHTETTKKNVQKSKTESDNRNRHANHSPARTTTADGVQKKRVSTTEFDRMSTASGDSSKDSMAALPEERPPRRTVSVSSEDDGPPALMAAPIESSEEPTTTTTTTTTLETCSNVPTVDATTVVGDHKDTSKEQEKDDCQQQPQHAQQQPKESKDGNATDNKAIGDVDIFESKEVDDTTEDANNVGTKVNAESETKIDAKDDKPEKVDPIDKDNLSDKAGDEEDKKTNTATDPKSDEQNKNAPVDNSMAADKDSIIPTDESATLDESMVDDSAMSVGAVNGSSGSMDEDVSKKSSHHKSSSRLKSSSKHSKKSSKKSKKKKSSSHKNKSSKEATGDIIIDEESEHEIEAIEASTTTSTDKEDPSNQNDADDDIPEFAEEVPPLQNLVEKESELKEQTTPGA